MPKQSGTVQYVGLMNALKYQWCATSCFEACDVQQFHLQGVWTIKEPVLYHAKNEEIYGIKHFSCHVTLFLKRKLQHVGHKWVISGFFCGSVGQMGQQV